MAELSFSNGAGTAGGLWSPAARIWEPVSAATWHVLDLSRFFPVAGLHWSDMMVSETRRQLAGCTNAVETALMVELDHDVAAVFPGGGADRLAWPILQSRPHLIGPALLAHMRLRAGVALLARSGGASKGDAVAPAAEDGWLMDGADGPVAQAAVVLALAEGRWSAVGGEDMPMRPDLPAEHFADLIWVVAAVLGTVLSRSGALAKGQAVAAVDAAALRLLARHDEGTGALAGAMALARLLRDRPDHAEHLGRALSQGRTLLFAALAAERAEIGMEAVLDALIQQPLPVLAGLCHVLGGSVSDFRHLLLRLQPVRGLDDTALLAAAASFEAMTLEDARAALAPLRRPPELRGPLGILDGEGGR